MSKESKAPGELIEKAKRFFTLYPHKDKLWATSDGNFFLVRSDCVNHAAASKSNYFEFERGGEAETVKTPGGEQDEVTLGLIARVLELDPDTHDYREMIKILHGLNVQPESLKKVDIIVSMKALKLKLQEAANQTSAPEAPAPEASAPEAPAPEAPAPPAE